MSYSLCGPAGRRFLVKAFGILLVAICCLVSLPIAQSALLNPGDTIFSSGENDPFPGAVAIVNPGAVPVPFVAPSFSGTLTSQVWTNDATNPWGLGAYTFTYRIHNDATSLNS